MTRKWNALVPVVAVVPGETAAGAIGTLKAQLSVAGFDVYDGEPGCNAFESEDSEDPAERPTLAAAREPMYACTRRDAQMSLAEIKRRVQPGQVYDVTNHYITRIDHPGYGTTRRTVTRITASRFYLAHTASKGETPIDWPKAAQVSIDADGVIRLRGGGAGQRPDEPFLTLTPVSGRTGEDKGTES